MLPYRPPIEPELQADVDEGDTLGDEHLGTLSVFLREAVGSSTSGPGALAPDGTYRVLVHAMALRYGAGAESPVGLSSDGGPLLT